MILNELLLKIDKNQSEINSHGKFDEAVLKKINYKFRLDWNYYSNKMEGGTLTRSETRSVMVGNVTVGGKPIKDVMEMKGHDNVVSDILKIGKGELRISEKRIKEIHKAIMHEEVDKQNLIGEWKKTANEVINYKNEKISFTKPENVQHEIHDLLNKTNAELDLWFQASKSQIHPLLLASNFHLEYVTIHPFYDGNGRTTRILTNLILISCGYPPIIIKETDKIKYYQYLADIQAYGGDKDLFYEFMAEKLLESQQLIIDAIEGKGIEEPDDVRKEIELLKTQLADKDYSKSPKKIYDIFNDINNQVWPKVKETLKSFDEFYSESKNEYFVNYDDEKYETHFRSLSSLVNTESSNKPAEIKIFGHNIYERDIIHIKWQQIKFGLKGNKKKSDTLIYLSLGFEQNHYDLHLILETIIIYSKQYSYSNLVNLDEIEDMKKKLGKELIKNIKENTGI